MIIEITVMKNDSPYWQDTISLAENCSWSGAGTYLAHKMRTNDFDSVERVICARDQNKVIGFCTFTKKDELPQEQVFSPFIGFVFVTEEYRGKRISQKMIDVAVEYAKTLGYPKIYIMSGEKGFYEKYGFTKIGDFETIHGTNDQLFVKET